MNVAQIWLQAETDENLMLTLQRQASHDAFMVLVKRYNQIVFRLCFRMVRDHALAEDLAQEVFIKLWQHPGRWDKNKSNRFRSWLFTVAINHTHDEIRKKNRIPPHDHLNDDLTSGIVADEDCSDDTEKEKILAIAFNVMKEHEKNAMMLAYEKGISNKDAAAVMGITLKAYQSLVARAKDKLRRRVAELLTSEQEYDLKGGTDGEKTTYI
ncbi:MAG: sigma-70 family RNA polymerase sigma factor [Alphaproteobacteria bacterium]|nr:sigma-70 family RNA polymerase sigma factor [Alphaproteobacteria bacterium]NDC56788.1 sigma-70 family RNA polymerase sigma factor [Alphaproteobacteria bacterium]